MTIKTHQQGSLDGLCGVYSVHNALRQLLGARTDDAFDQRLFRAVLRALPRSAYPEVLWRGMDVDRLYRVSARACEYLFEKHRIEITAHRPFARRRFRFVRDYLDALDEIAATEFASFILGLEWVRDGGGHWSVYRGREGGKLRLYDSGRMHSLATLVFTSLRPSDVVVTETSSQGVRSFREYLAYAEGAAFVDDETGGTPDSDFEEYVAERIRANGYQVVPQVGVEGFRIDLGIKHPSYPSGFLAGVECDGATYHSGLSVRDRDRIRQDVLERLGWRIYRVWSTDWFNDPERETTKLIAWLDRLREKAEASAASRRARETQPLSAKPAARRVEPSPPTPVTKKPTEQLLPLEPVAQRPNEQLLPLEPVSKPAPSSAPDAASRAPSGKRHAVDGIEFYEEMPGYFEVWIDGAARGSVERLTTAMSAAKVYAGAFQAQKPQFEVTRYWDESTFICDDIYVAVRKLASNYRELAHVEA